MSEKLATEKDLIEEVKHLLDSKNGKNGKVKENDFRAIKSQEKQVTESLKKQFAKHNKMYCDLQVLRDKLELPNIHDRHDSIGKLDNTHIVDKDIALVNVNVPFKYDLQFKECVVESWENLNKPDKDITELKHNLMGWSEHSIRKPQISDSNGGGPEVGESAVMTVVTGKLILAWETQLPRTGTFAIKPENNELKIQIDGSFWVDGITATEQAKAIARFYSRVKRNNSVIGLSKIETILNETTVDVHVNGVTQVIHNAGDFSSYDKSVPKIKTHPLLNAFYFDGEEGDKFRFEIVLELEVQTMHDGSIKNPDEIKAVIHIDNYCIPATSISDLKLYYSD
jgi:hypothetical protein